MLKNIPLRALEPWRLTIFHSRVDRSAGENLCWPWTGGFDGNGYGRMKVDGGASVRAHRLSYYIANGVDPADKMVCHSCDNPPCCNPAHLWLGDNRANQMDASSKGRKPPTDSAGEKNPMAKLSAADIEKVRAMIQGGSTNVAIGRVFGVTHQMISRIRRGRAWGEGPMQAPYESLKRARF